MNLYSNIPSAAIAIVHLSLASTAAAQPTIDDFEDGKLDPTLWQTDLTAPASSVIETNGRAEINNRAILSTVRSYDPAIAPIRIEARITWEISGSGELFSIYTRCSGVSDVNDHYRPTTGVTCNIDYNEFEIGAERPGDNNDSSLVSEPASPEPGDVFDVVITDDGSTVTFDVTEVGGDGDGASLVAGSAIAGSSRVSFLNREFGRTSALNDVTIQYESTCPGDVDLNGVVEVNDISSVIFRLGLEPGDFGYEPSADADNSGAIDVNDISFVVFRLGTSCP